METHSKELNEAFLDEAAAAAIGMATVEETDALVLALAHADEDHRQAARDLRDVVARLAGASPYMEPPAGLRGRILAATADKPMKMEDYRRATAPTPWWQRWGLVAAMLFLAASAWYNTSLKTAYDKNVVAFNQQQQALSALQAENQALTVRNVSATEAMAALIDQRSTKTNMVDSKTQQSVGMLVQAADTNKIWLVMPKTPLPANSVAQMTIEQGGVQHKIQAVALGSTGGMAAELKQPLKTGEPMNVQVGDGPRVYVAGQPIH